MPYIQQLLILCPIIFLSGFIDSIAGGGGIIAIPAYLAVGLTPHMVLGTGKLSSSLGCFTSTVRFVKNEHYSKEAILPAVLSALIGSALGAMLAIYLNAEVLNYLLIVTLPFIAIFILTRKDFAEPAKKDMTRQKTIAACIFIGLTMGFYDGFLGSGSGTFFILMFTSIAGLDLLSSMGTSKIVNVATNISAIFIFMYHGQIDYKLAFPTAIAAILGNYLGSGLAIKNGKKLVKPMLVIVLCMLLIKVVYDTFTT